MNKRKKEIISDTSNIYSYPHATVWSPPILRVSHTPLPLWTVAIETLIKLSEALRCFSCCGFE